MWPRKKKRGAVVPVIASLPPKQHQLPSRQVPEPKKSQEGVGVDDDSDCLKLYVLNGYLLPTAFTFNPIFWGCVKQPERARKMAKTLQDFDVSCLQEIWGSGSDELSNSLMDSHAMRTHVTTGLGSLNPLANFSRGWLNAEGGLFESWSRKRVSVLMHDKMRFSRSVPFAKQGASGLLLKVHSWRDVFLVVFNCHFSILGGGESRESNLEELVSFMRQFLAMVMVAGVTPSRCVVLLCGDFNISQGSPLYEAKLLCLAGFGKVLDVFDGNAPPTVVRHDKHAKTGNSYFYWNFTGKVDHVLVVEALDPPAEFDFADRWRFSPVVVVDAQVETKPYGQEFSDHYGVSVVVKPGAPSVAPPRALKPTPPCEESFGLPGVLLY